MKLKIFRYRELLILGIALGFLFLGWNAAEQHLTSFYQSTEGQANIGLNSLVILYAFTIVGNFFGPILAQKVGLKVSIILGFTAYTVLVFGVISKITFIIYILSALLGIGAGILGVAQIDLIRIYSPKGLRGELTGSVNALRTIGGALGVFLVGLLLKIINIKDIYFLLGTVMTISILILLTLKTAKESDKEKGEKISKTIAKTITMFKETKLLLTVPLSVANGFLLGLILGAIPVSITQSFGIEYVGLTMFMFHLTLSFSGFFSGRISDKIGRFNILYLSILTGIVASFIVISTTNVYSIILAMLFAGFFSATNGVVMAALFIDLFEKRIKEARAASGIIGTLLGIVPAFILNKYFSATQLLYLAIFLFFVGGASLKFLEVKEERVKLIKNKKNLGYGRNLQVLKKMVKGDILFLMGQDDVLLKDALLKTYGAFLKRKDIGVVTRPYYWFDEDFQKPVRTIIPYDKNRDAVISVFDGKKEVQKIFESVGQLSGLAYRLRYLKTDFHRETFPAHIYPFAMITKKYKVVYLKDCTVAVRIASSQTRFKSSIYDISPTKSWVKMFNRVYRGKKCEMIREAGIEQMAKNFIGLVQLKNYSTFKYLIREIYILLKLRPTNIISYKFWFFSLGTIIIPRKVLVWLVDNYKRKILSWRLKKISV